MAGKLSMDQVFIEKLTDILQVNLEKEQFGVKELAEEAGLSRSQLHRRLHAINGKSASQLIREYRLQKAMVMLQNNVATVSEIAYRVGFGSPTYFNTCFHEYYGYPPGEVKNKAVKISEQDTATTAPIGKITFKNRWILVISIGIVIIMAISYSFYIGSKNNKVIEPAKNLLADRSIAVMPIKNWSGDPELEYISDGMTDAIISRLTKIKSLTSVIPFTSVIKYKTSDKSVPFIAKELGVQNILQGNFQLSGDQMKITLQLIDGPSNKHFWAHEYTGKWKSNDIFTIQTKVAENIADKMNIEINTQEVEALNEYPTQNNEAYNLFLQAVFQSNKYTKNGMDNAVPLYKKAISLDSTFFDAHVHLAYLYLWGGASWGLYNEKEAWHKAKQLLLKATQMDSTDVALNRALAYGLYMYEWDFDRMEKEYKTGSNPDILYELLTGRYEESLALINQGLKENPTSTFMYAFKAQALFYLNRKEEATDLLKSNDRFYDDDIMYLRIASKCYFYMGEYDNSKALLNKIMTNFSDRPPIVLWLNAVHEERDGNTEGANRYLGDLQKKYESGKSGSPAWFTALYYCTVQDYDNTFTWLQRSYDRHEVEMIQLREEPVLIPLRNDKRYLELYRKVGFPVEPHTIPE